MRAALHPLSGRDEERRDRWLSCVFHPSSLDAGVPIKREQTRHLPDISAQHQTSSNISLLEDEAGCHDFRSHANTMFTP